MNRRYLAFDIEIAKILPDEVDDLKGHRPLGICCAAALAGDDDQPHLWFSSDARGQALPRMSREDLRVFVEFLREQQAQGYTLLSWNGLSFDFDILAEESGEWRTCEELAIDHVDMMFHVFCEKGFCVGLEAATKAIGVEGKTAGMNAELIPQLWAKGETESVLAYVANDCRMTIDVAHVSEHDREFAWITRRETRGSMFLRNGWRTCRNALKTPLPDTSWMDTPPWPRSRFTSWFRETVV